MFFTSSTRKDTSISFCCFRLIFYCDFFFFFNPLLIARPVLVDPQPALIAPSFFCLSHFLNIILCCKSYNNNNNNNNNSNNNNDNNFCFFVLFSFLFLFFVLVDILFLILRFRIPILFLYLNSLILSLL